MKQKMTAYTVLMMVLLLAATLFTKQMLPEEFDIGDYSQVDLLQAQAQFEVSQSNEDLVLLCKTLCWRWKASGCFPTGRFSR